MSPRDCGFAYPPADGTRDREILDRFADFLRVAGPPARKADVEAGRTKLRPAWQRYHLRFLAWRMEHVQ